MATNYPTSVDTPQDPTGTNTMDGVTGGAGVVHATQHANSNDGLVAVQNALGFTGAFNFLTTAQGALKAPLAGPALTGTPTAPTATALTNSTQLATTAYADAADAVVAAAHLGALKLTAVKTANYNAVASDMVACDISGGAFTVTLPTAPANQTTIGVMVVKQATTPGAVAATTILTVAAGGSDVFDIAGGSQTAAMPLQNMQSTFIYNSAQAIWTNGVGRLARASLTPTKTVAPTTTYTALAGDIVLCTAGAGGFTVTLPAVTKNAQVLVKKVDSAGGTITVTPASGTIDGAANKTLIVQYDALALVCDGTNWNTKNALVGNANFETLVRANSVTQLVPPTASILQVPQIFTASGTWTPGTFGAAIFIATLVGGGGGGGAGSSSNGGGGGGGGEVLIDYYLGNVTGAQTVTIAAVSSGAGNTTSIGALVTAAGGGVGTSGTLTGVGGQGGDGGVVGPAVNTAGAGSTGGYGTATNVVGARGGPGQQRLGAGGGGGGGPTSAPGGKGGASTGGAGGTGASTGGGGGGGGGGGAGTNGSAGVGGAGAAALANFGGGGGGGGAGTSPGAGGTGGTGYVIITQIA